MAHSQMQLLTSKKFLPFFVTQFLGAFNDNIFKNALVILLTYHAAGKIGGDARLLVTASAGIFILPFFLFSAMAGQFADKFSKEKIIRIVKLAEIALMGLACAGFMFENYWLLMAILFGMGVHSTFFGPLKYSIMPQLLKGEELIGGNALVEAGTFLAILLGTMLGGILVLKSGGIVMVCGLLMLLALGGWLASTRIAPCAPAVPGLVIGYNFIAETFRIIRHTYGEKDVFLSIIGISWFWLVGFTFLAQFPVYASEVLGANEQVVTLFLTVFSVGIGIGALACEKLLKGEIAGVYVPLGAAGMTVGTLLFWAFSPSVPVQGELIGIGEFLHSGRHLCILGSLMVTSIFGGLYTVPLYAIMQSYGDPAFRSRTIAANNILNALFMVAGAVITVVLTKMQAPITQIFLLVGIVNIPVIFLVKYTVRKRRSAKGLV